MQRHVQTINPDGTFAYTGDMDKDQAIQLFNELMHNGIRVDIEPGLKKMIATGHATPGNTRRFRAIVQRAYRKQSQTYGHLVFALVCDGRITGQRNLNGQFEA